MSQEPDGAIELRSQIESMARWARAALDYHFKALTRAEDCLRSYSSAVHLPRAYLESLDAVRFEQIAYLNQVGRTNFFFHRMIERGYLLAEELPDLKTLKLFRNKWASHRAPDFPRDEPDYVHSQLLTLDSAQMFNLEFEILLTLQDGQETHELNLTREHARIADSVSRTLRLIQARAGMRAAGTTACEASDY